MTCTSGSWPPSREARENLAIAEVIERTRWTRARTHILPLSSSDALPMLASAKHDGIDLTVETCPHYLTLTAEEIPNGGRPTGLPADPEIGNRERLWEGLLDGTIDYIASDHSPSTLELKDLEHGDFAVAWGGIASVQLALSLVWTEARRRGLGLEQVIDWMATKPAAWACARRSGWLPATTLTWRSSPRTMPTWSMHPGFTTRTR